MIRLKNDFLEVAIAPKGAELKSVRDLNKPFEYMWQATAPHWGRTAPVLFPFVGALKEKTYKYQGQPYHMGQHGFARDFDFTVVDQGQDQAYFELKASDETQKIYPFDFSLRIDYHLKDRVLAISYHVENLGLDPMYFSIGGHPGFNMNLEAGGVSLNFEKEEALNTECIDMDRGLIKRGFKPLADGVSQLRLSKSTFDEDALIFKGLMSTYVTVTDAKTDRSVTLSLVGVPKLGVWSDKGPFVCLEPWWGIADYVDATQDLTTKDMINKLGPGQIFTCGYDLMFK